jgi:quercetin dioxygenase-like cupin family protein
MEVIISWIGDREQFRHDHRDVTIRLVLPRLSRQDVESEPDREVPEHRYDDVDALYVLAGMVEFVTGDTSVRVGPGTHVAAPAGAPNAFREAGPGKAGVLVLRAPEGGFTVRIRDS